METPDKCDSCGHSGVPLKTYLGRLKDNPRVPEGWKKDLILCGLCASTKTGTMLRFPPKENSENSELMRHICFVGNEILSAIERARSQVLDTILVEELRLTQRVDGMTGLLDRNLKSKDSTLPPPQVVERVPAKKKRPKKS